MNSEFCTLLYLLKDVQQLFIDANGRNHKTYGCVECDFCETIKVGHGHLKKATVFKSGQAKALMDVYKMDAIEQYGNGGIEDS